MVLAYNTNAGGGLLSGAEKLSSAYLERNRRKGLASGLEQIQGGDWEGGVNTIAQTDPDTALGLAQYKQEADDKIALQQAKMQQEAELRNTLTPYQQEMLALKRMQLAQNGGGTGSIKNIEYLVGQGYTPEQAANMVFSGQNPAVQGLGQKGMEAYDKKVGETLGDEFVAERQLKTLKPKAENALQRAEESLNEGTGLGQVGGWGWTTGQGGKNRANIKNAQAQINTTMRGLLSQMGVGASELNSAAEAEAYRYMLTPDMPIEQQRQVINNFKQDYLNGTLENELREIYGKSSYKSKYGLE